MLKTILALTQAGYSKGDIDALFQISPQAQQVTEPVPQAQQVTAPVPQAQQVTVPVPQAQQVTVPLPQAQQVTVPVPQAQQIQAMQVSPTSQAVTHQDVLSYIQAMNAKSASLTLPNQRTTDDILAERYVENTTSQSYADWLNSMKGDK